MRRRRLLDGLPDRFRSLVSRRSPEPANDVREPLPDVAGGASGRKDIADEAFWNKLSHMDELSLDDRKALYEELYTRSLVSEPPPLLQDVSSDGTVREGAGDGTSAAVSVETSEKRPSPRSRSSRRAKPSSSSGPATKVTVSAEMYAVLSMFVKKYNLMHPDGRLSVREFVDDALRRQMRRLSSATYEALSEFMKEGAE